MAEEQQHLEAELGDLEGMHDDGEDAQAEQELEAMKARLADMEKEAAKLKEMQDKVQKEAGLAPGGSAAAAGTADQAAKEEVDSRSIYVGNVDYSATPEELQVAPKRTNVPGMKAHRGRGRGRGRGGGGYYGFMPMPPPFMMGYGYGYAPRGRGRGRGGYFPY
eukprot:scaffold20.g7780.t1